MILAVGLILLMVLVGLVVKLCLCSEHEWVSEVTRGSDGHAHWYLRCIKCLATSKGVHTSW